jgi:hypothetical protein
MSAQGRARRRWWVWLVVAAVVVVFAIASVITLPILLHRNAGLSTQQDPGDAWPVSVTAQGDDGRTRVLSVSGPDGTVVDTSALAAGDRVVVTGTGYDASRGIYVAVCVIPSSPDVKPGPCIGGSPQETQDPAANAGAVQYAPSNWINDDWAWKLFGSRSYDAAGGEGGASFTAYLEIGEPVGPGYDCTVQRCGIVTRNDHTASNDRVQDVYLPIGFLPPVE